MNGILFFYEFAKKQILRLLIISFSLFLMQGIGFCTENKYIVDELYPGHNNIRSNRLNIIFIGGEYNSFEEFEKICKDMIALNGENRYGLMQIKPFSEPGFDKHFNFWICRKIPKSGKPYKQLTNQIMWELIKPVNAEAIEDLNRHYRANLKYDGRNILPVMIANTNPREIPNYNYGGGSFGRGGTFTVWKIGNPWFAYNDMIVTHIHELMHSIPELYDEYGGSGSIYDDPGWKTRKYGKQFFVPGSSEDPGKITKERFLKLSETEKLEYVKQNCPWKNYIGKGTGVLKTGIFEGGLGKNQNIYRSVQNSIMNYPYNLVPGKTLGFGEYLENLIREKIIREFGK
ncbi:MAG: hypothetical protein LWY06_13680 [Firmicutes bacterium]|nr:hypothetical protein [Bacillota bacterium]